MAVLHVRGVPSELRERPRRRAAAESRSISAEVIVLLEAAVRADPAEQAQILADIRRRRSQVKPSCAPDANNRPVAAA